MTAKDALHARIDEFSDEDAEELLAQLEWEATEEEELTEEEWELVRQSEEEFARGEFVNG